MRGRGRPGRTVRPVTAEWARRDLRPWNPWPVLLRMMRDPVSGRPAPLARLVAVLLVVGLVALTAPILIPVVRWFVDLL